MAYESLSPAELGDVTKYKVLLYGDSGTGKTWAASSASNPLCLVTEANALGTLREAFNAHPRKRASIVHAHGRDALQTIREVLMDARRGTLVEAGFDTLVIDGLTDLQKLIRDDIVGVGNDETTMKDWATLTDRMRRLLRELRDCPMDVVCTALADAEFDEGSSKRYVYPLFQGRKLQNEVAGFFNIVGYCYKRDDGVSAKRWAKEKDAKVSDGKSGVAHQIIVSGPEGILSKGCGPIIGVQDADIDGWFKLLRTAPDKRPSNPPEQADDKDSSIPATKPKPNNNKTK
jgi:hypothetical protein